MGLPTWQWQHLKLRARQGAVSYALRHGGSSLRVRQLLTMAEYRPEASPSEAYGTLTKCPLVACCRLEAGGQSGGEPPEVHKAGGLAGETASNCGRRAGSRVPPQDTRLAAGPGSRDGWSVHAAQISGSAEGKCLKQAVT